MVETQDKWVVCPSCGEILHPIGIAARPVTEMTCSKCHTTLRINWEKQKTTIKQQGSKVD
jgi:DNA-directed RNA polymerase subunit M/transcription elongation factor TFIIS